MRVGSDPGPTALRWDAVTVGQPACGRGWAQGSGPVCEQPSRRASCAERCPTVEKRVPRQRKAVPRSRTAGGSERVVLQSTGPTYARVGIEFGLRRCQGRIQVPFPFNCRLIFHQVNLAGAAWAGGSRTGPPKTPGAVRGVLPRRQAWCDVPFMVWRSRRVGGWGDGNGR